MANTNIGRDGKCFWFSDLVYYRWYFLQKLYIPILLDATHANLYNRLYVVLKKIYIYQAYISHKQKINLQEHNK